MSSDGNTHYIIVVVINEIQNFIAESFSIYDHLEGEIFNTRLVHVNKKNVFSFLMEIVLRSGWLIKPPLKIIFCNRYHCKGFEPGSKNIFWHLWNSCVLVIPGYFVIICQMFYQVYAIDELILVVSFKNI